jgi:hypothetical protein
MRRKLIVVVILLAVVGAACGDSEAAPAPEPVSDPSPEPPLATLTVGNSEQIAAGQGSFCWRHSDGRPFCKDTFATPTAVEPIITESPFAAHLLVPIQQSLTELLLEVKPVTDENLLDSTVKGWQWWRPDFEDRQKFSLSLECETVVDLSLEPGLYVLSLFARVQDMGSASYGFLVEVQ